MSVTTKLITAEELLAMGDIGRCELINGEIHHMTPAGAEHGDIALELAYRIKAHVEANHLGKIFAAETGFIISKNPDTVRAPDVGFVASARLPSKPVKGFFPGGPDLAVEVLSPGDSASEVAEKVDLWLSSGATSVWVADPVTRSITIYRNEHYLLRYRISDTITNESTLPGFELKISSIFPS